MDPVLKWSFLGAGVFTLAVAFLLARRPLRLLRAGGRAEGEITDNIAEVHSGGKGAARTYYFPQIAFTTAKGERISFRSAHGGAQPMPVGKRIALLYDPANPVDAMPDLFITKWMFPLVTLLFGSPFLAVGIWGLLQ